MEEQKKSQESYATEISQLSDLKNYIGKELGVSEWTTISQNQIDTFARTTDDNQWIHINPEMAKKTFSIPKTNCTWIFDSFFSF